jgi:hypothetical protein
MVGVNLVDRLIEGAKACRIVNVKWRDVVLLKDVGKLAVGSAAAAALTAVVRLLVLGQRPFLVLGCLRSSFLSGLRAVRFDAIDSHRR